MSTLAITFTVQVLDFEPLTRGQIEIVFDDGNSPQPVLIEILSSISTWGRFAEIPYDAGNPSLNDTQAGTFASAFQRDYRNIGGADNIVVSVVDNIVTLTAAVGTFTSYAYTGNVILASGIIGNSVQTSALASVVTQHATIGDCNTIQFSATATGGVAPYLLTDDGATIQAGWDGTSTTFNLSRGIPHSIKVTESANALTATKNPIVPRILAAGDFKISVVPFSTSSDITVNRVTVIANTGILQYSLDLTTETTGQNYQTSNVFAGVAPDTYKLFVKDAYGCEIFKTIVIADIQDATVNENARYFDIPEGQSIIYSVCPTFSATIKKNYFNSRSNNENKFINRTEVLSFDPVDTFVGTQFKSSYNWHTVTLHGCDGTQQDITNLMIQQNLGVVVKMDCTLFPLEGKTGIYFQGGNTYIADTTTVLPEGSDYNGTTPSWAKVGQLVFLDGLGGFYIESEGYDNTKGGYFVLNFFTASEIAGKIQVTHNEQIYNTFEFYIDANAIPTTGFIVVEKGFEVNVAEGDPWISELVTLKTDEEDVLLLEWADTKNKGDIVYQSGIGYKARLDGELYATWDGSSETTDGDNQVFSLEQKQFIEFELIFEAVTTKRATQLSIASGLDNFNANNLLLVRKSVPEVTRLGKSNLHKWKCTFGFGGNLLGIQQDELVLSATTGVVGGGTTGKSETISLTGLVLYKDASGNLIRNGVNLSKQ